jgi:quinoprotein glucose dehydrogenase
MQRYDSLKATSGIGRALLSLPFLLLFPALLGGQNDWPAYGHDPGGARYSPLTQINRDNVGTLKRVWTYDATQQGSVTQVERGRAGSFADRSEDEDGVRARRPRRSQMTPLVIGNVMYLTTPFNRAVALDPETGKEIWGFDIRGLGTPAMRGLAYWPGDKQAPSTLFFGTQGGYLVALNSRTGKPVPGFGKEGVLNLREGMADKFPEAPYGMSSPPAVYQNLVITGSAVQESPALGPPGDIRAFDVHTGKLVWTFHTIARPGEPGSETWAPESQRDRSGANVWGIMTVDVSRGTVYLPIGCPTQDYYGADRKGANLYSTSLVALEAATGKLKWHFQVTHHDIWDYDLNAPPALIDITVNGAKIPAVAQMTKQGLLFVLDRTTGKPVYGVEERPVPQEGFVAAEHPWPTQPFPVKPLPLARNSFSPDELAKITPDHEQYCREMLAANGGLRTGGPYLGFGEKPSILFPGTLGGGNWNGVSFDPALGYIFVNTQSFGEVFQIVKGERGPTARRYKFWDDDKLWPCSKPPWGELSAIDTRTGDIAWRVPLGVFDELEAKGIPKTGTPNIGGPIATAGGLVFIGATVDDRFRAFDSKTGKELWVTNVGAAARAVPITYQARNGKQYVVVMVSGGGYLGDHVGPATLMAFTLP